MSTTPQHQSPPVPVVYAYDPDRIDRLIARDDDRRTARLLAELVGTDQQ
jgi:hypothetical protein